MGWLFDALAWLGDGENWTGPDGVAARLVEHVGLSAAAVAIACLIALPLAVWLGHIGRGGVLAVNVTNIGRAVPTFAVLTLLALAPSPFGLNTTSTLTALVLFALPPILTNTYVGMREVDPGAVDAARGMGMSGWEVVRRVELPLAVPLVMAGVRLGATQVVATATIAALVAGGGLGRIITAGYARQDQAQLIAGAIVVAVLALAVEGVMAVLQRVSDPMRPARASQRAATTGATTDGAPAGIRDDVVTEPGMNRADP
jgi:osmoprotectant transport system permease protein